MKRMKKSFSIILLTTMSLLVILNTASSQETAGQLFEKALYLEEGKGELQPAIELYQQILDKYPGDREVAAKSLLHMGMCYEKLGNRDAKKAYQEVIQNYGEQKDIVKIAREQLSRLILMAEKIVKTPIKPKFTKIKIPTKLSWSIKLSPDGKELASVYDKKLWKMPISGNLGPEIPGTPVQVNTEGIEIEWSGLAWSQNGQWIAFNDYPQKSDSIGNQGIYVVSSAGGQPQKILENYRDARVVNYRISLSPDGNTLAFSSVENTQQFIYTIPVKGGVPLKLTTEQSREAVFSPDGKMIAYVADKDVGRGSGNLGLWLIPVTGGTPNLIAKAGKASSPMWSPDGKMIAFLDYTRTKQIFIVPVSKAGQGLRKPISIDAPEGTEEVILLAGWTPDNKIGVLSVTKKEYALYTLPADGGQAAIILHDTHALQPRWSRNGKQIYYVTLPEEGENRFYRLGLATVSSDGGPGRSLPVFSKDVAINQLGFQSGNRLSPDGKMIISAAWTASDVNSDFNFPRANIWKIATDSSEAIQMTHKEGPFADTSPCWSPYGKKVAFIRCELKKGGKPYWNAGIYIVDALEGEPELLVSESGKWVNSLIWSPDGIMIAWLSQEQEAAHTKAKVINVYDFNRKESRIVGEVPVQHVHIEMAWSPDSKQIAFNDGEGKVIKIMSLDDGSIEEIKTGLVDVTIHHLDWSPDDGRFVFGGIKGGNKEFWFLEDFLPLEKTYNITE